MKTEAYVCDFCGELKFAAEVVGISQQVDMFNKLESYPASLHADKSLVHLCTPCYNERVVNVAAREHDRRKDEAGYTLKLKEMFYLVKNQCVVNYNKKVQKKVAGKR